MTPNKSVDFFDNQFRRQVAAGDFTLNPFETACLPLARGRVLDFGCGLGNLAIALARRGLEVTAIDASPAAIGHIRDVATGEGLRIDAQCAEVSDWNPPGSFDTVIAIGLLMFFPREKAHTLLARIQACTSPGGIAFVNVLTEGTTFLGMFEPGHYYLFGRDELRERFAGWTILHDLHQTFDAPGGTQKVFATLAARKDGGPGHG